MTAARSRRFSLALVVFASLTSCRTGEPAPPPAPAAVVPDLDPLAERYVRLMLEIGRHDGDFVDAYYGDPTWKPTGEPVALAELASRITVLREDVARAALPPESEELLRLRHEYLDKQLQAAETRVAFLEGKKLPFDEEARRIYDVTPPRHAESDFTPILAELDKLLPGRGSLPDRLARLRARVFIAKPRLEPVFRAAIDECRRRTVEHLGAAALPPEESFQLEFVTGKSWSAYNWYQGGYRSLIQVNTDLPITIDRALDLACHEGYPGHHVYNLLLEKHLVRDRGWVEFAVYPLFSPQSLIAEGTANFGIEVAFPGEARLAFERDVLYPLAGLDPSLAEVYANVQNAIQKLSYAGNEAARRYLDGEIDRAAAAAWLERFAMMPADRAEQRTRFFDQYRSYVINYNLGRDLVRGYVERKGGTADRPDVRWAEFGRLLSSPRLPSGLR
jgi:hypothetical protein